MSRIIQIAFFVLFMTSSMSKLHKKDAPTKKESQNNQNSAKNIKFVETAAKVTENKAEKEKSEESSSNKEGSEESSSSESGSESESGSGSKSKAVDEKFMGKYVFAEDPRQPNLNGLMQICCKEYMKICGHTLNFQKSEQDAEKMDIFQGFVFRYRCENVDGPDDKKFLSCVMKRGPKKYYLNIDASLNVFSTSFVADQNYAPYQCKGKLVKIPEVKKKKKAAAQKVLL